MPILTTNQHLRYPAADDAADGPLGFRNLAEDIERIAVGRFADAADRSARLPDPVAGMVTWVDNPGRHELWDGTAYRALTTAPTTPDDIPAPWIIPHRGGANIMPESTLDAYRSAVQLTPIVDVDVWSLHGGGLGVMHDSTMDRTTAGHGPVNDHSPQQFISQIVQTADFYAAYPTTQYPLLLEQLFAEFGASVVYTPEIKSPSTDAAAGPRLLALIQRYGLERNCIVQADSLDTLEPFVAAGIGACLGSIASDSVASGFTPDAVVSAGVGYVSVSAACADTVFNAYGAAGLRVFGYTVDRHTVRDRLLSLTYPVFGIFTNDPGYLSPDVTRYQRSYDWYRGYRWDHGMQLSASRSDRYNINLTGATSNGVMGYIDAGAGPQTWQMLQGFLAPLDGDAFSLTLSARTPIALAGDHLRWCSVFLGTTDLDWTDPGAAGAPGVNGYHLVMRMTGGMTIYRVDDGIGTQIANRSGTADWPTNVWQTYKITVSASAVSMQHIGTTDPATLTAPDTAYRGLRYPWIGFAYNAGQQIHVGAVSVS